MWINLQYRVIGFIDRLSSCPIVRQPRYELISKKYFIIVIFTVIIACIEGTIRIIIERIKHNKDNTDIIDDIHNKWFERIIDIFNIDEDTNTFEHTANFYEIYLYHKYYYKADKLLSKKETEQTLYIKKVYEESKREYLVARLAGIK